jgi:hypothetical protein
LCARARRRAPPPRGRPQEHEAALCELKGQLDAAYQDLNDLAFQAVRGVGEGPFVLGWRWGTVWGADWQISSVDGPLEGSWV